MSIFSSIGSAIGSAYKSVYNAVKSLTGTQTASAASPVFGSSEYMRQTAKQGSGYGSLGTGKVPMGASGSWTPTLSAGQLSPSLNSGLASSGSGAFVGPQLPVAINAGQQKVSSGGGGSSQLSLGGYNPQAFAPVTISAKTLGASTLGSTGGTGLNAPTGGATQPLVTNNTPRSSGGNPIDNTRLAGILSPTYKYNPSTRMMEEIAPTQPEQQTVDTKIQKELDYYKKYLGEKPSVYEDAQVQEAQRQRRMIQESLKAPTDELNAIIARQNQDLLQLRATGAKEGVTEAVYGEQANAINYNASIRALPLQARVAAIQGDLKLAQDYLSELTQVKQDQINRQYEANKAQFEMIRGIITKEDERTYNELKTANDRAYNEQKDLIKYQADTIKSIYENYGANVPQTVVDRINNATSVPAVLAAAGQYLGKTTTTGQVYNTSQEKVIDSINSSVSNDFGYKAVDSARNFADGTISALNQKTGLGDVAAINQFQKVIDEGAVTREQDVRLVQGAQSLADSLKLKIKKLQKGDQLTETQREQMKKTVLDLYQAKVENLVDNPYIQSQILKAQRLGISADDTILGQLGTFNAEQTTTGAVSEGTTKVWEGVTYKVVNGVWTPQ